MLQYLYADELANNAKLQESMFLDRADQFRERLGWDVTVDQSGFERDEYDLINPLYVIWTRPDGLHGGSMRVLPTSGPCMTNDHFSTIAGRKIRHPLIWESTRFCLSPELGTGAGNVSAALMMAGCEIGLGFGLEHAVGVFDPRMVRIYRTMGWPPVILGSDGFGRDKIYVGQWSFSEDIRRKLAAHAGIDPAQSTEWFYRAFEAPKIDTEFEVKSAA